LKKQDFHNGASFLPPNIEASIIKAVKSSAGTTLALDSLEQKENTPKIEMARKDSSPFLACLLSVCRIASNSML